MYVNNVSTIVAVKGLTGSADSRTPLVGGVSQMMFRKKSNVAPSRINWFKRGVILDISDCSSGGVTLTQL